MINRLALGTVQFGLPYGIANRGGQISQQEAQKILRLAWRSGINTLDTAVGYGTSEQVLGAVGVTDWRVITKVPSVPEECPCVDTWMRSVVTDSLKKLNLQKIYGLLLHRPLELLGETGETMCRLLTSLKEEGQVEKIGFSIQSPADLDYLWNVFRPDLVQAPFNVFDRRIQTSGWLQKMHQAGTEIHTRSTFLQGLLLIDDAARPKQFDQWSEHWSEWDTWLEQHKLNPLQASLAVALFQPEIERIVVGVDTAEHLAKIIAASRLDGESPPLSMMSNDENLINPARWNMK
jgi:aryl-alcohol dehydrogenase-like predicted oxidoreductase